MGWLPLKVSLLGLLGALLAGCTAQGPTLGTLPGNSLPTQTELRATPFFPQEDYQCGPAALATMLTASGIATTPEALVPQVYLPKRQGSLQPELIAASRQYDRLPYVLDPELSQVVAEIAAGRPVLVMQNLGVAAYPIWHFAVVIGYDRNAEELVLRSGTTERLLMSTRRFLASWSRAERWAMVLLEPGALPVNPDPMRYLTAAAALEATGRLDAAAIAYAKGRERWPDLSLPHLGLANIAYTRGDLAGAIQAYDEALRRDPSNLVARHNLAESLAALGCMAAARRELDETKVLAQQTPFAAQVSATAQRVDAMPESAVPPALCASR